MVDGKELKKKLIIIFKKHGLSSGGANISFNAIINAEFVGAHTHGLARLRRYCEIINKKVIIKNQNGRIRDIQVHPTTSKIYLLTKDALWLMEKN